jgi:hypothetical protein
MPTISWLMPAGHERKEPLMISNAALVLTRHWSRSPKRE